MQIYLLDETERRQTKIPTVEDFMRIDGMSFDGVDCSDIPEVRDFSGFKKKNIVRAFSAKLKRERATAV